MAWQYGFINGVFAPLQVFLFRSFLLKKNRRLPIWSSKCGQDRFVCESFGFLRDGFFVDFAASNSIKDSNTYFLESQLNWSGICIPTNLCAPKYPSTRQQSIQSQTTFLAAICEMRKNRGIDYFSFDANKFDIELLLSFPFDEFPVKSITLTHNFQDAQKRAVRDILASRGFRLFRELDGSDCLFNVKVTSLSERVIAIGAKYSAGLRKLFSAYDSDATNTPVVAFERSHRESDLNDWLIIMDVGSLGHFQMYQFVYSKIAQDLGLNVLLISPCASDVCERIADLNLKNSMIGIDIKRHSPSKVHSILAKTPIFRAFLNGYVVRQNLIFALRAVHQFPQVKDYFSLHLCFDGVIEALSKPFQSQTLRIVRELKLSGIMFGLYREGIASGVWRKNVEDRKLRVLARMPQVNYFLVPSSRNEIVRICGRADHNRMIADVTDVRVEQHAPACLARIMPQINKPICLMTGTISERKGIRHFAYLAKAFANSPVHFMMVGPQIREGMTDADHGDISCIKSMPNVTIVDAVLSDSELNWVLSKSSLLFVGYLNFDFSSNLLVKAAYFRIPVLSSDGLTMKKWVEEFRLGRVYLQNSMDDLVSTFQRMLDESFHGSFDATLAQRYYEMNSEAVIRSEICHLSRVYGSKTNL
jgi:hypothetical protein